MTYIRKVFSYFLSAFSQSVRKSEVSFTNNPEKPMKNVLLALVIFAALSVSTFAQDAMIGEIRIYSGQRVPNGWLKCEGQLLKILAYQPLYSIIGTKFGGDGKTTFALPDLRSACAVGANANILPLGKKIAGDISPKHPGDAKPTVTVPGILSLTYIICINGIYPSFD